MNRTALISHRSSLMAASARRARGPLVRTLVRTGRPRTHFCLGATSSRRQGPISVWSLPSDTGSHQAASTQIPARALECGCRQLRRNTRSSPHARTQRVFPLREQWPSVAVTTWLRGMTSRSDPASCPRGYPLERRKARRPSPDRGASSSPRRSHLCKRGGRFPSRTTCDSTGPRDQHSPRQSSSGSRHRAADEHRHERVIGLVIPI